MTPSWKNLSLREVALRVGHVLKTHGIEAVLVGGACVSIYSQNRYASKDLDLVTLASMQAVKDALQELGFEQKSRRHFEKQDCPFYIEFVAPPVAIGNQPVTTFGELKSPIGEIKLLTPTDCVKDRLAAFFYWDDYQSFNQALMVAKKHKINWKNIHAWAAQESQVSKYRQFRKKLIAPGSQERKRKADI